MEDRGLQDFQQLQGHLQHLDFEVWEHPNLKVSTLTLKDEFLKKLVLLPLLKSKRPTTCTRIAQDAHKPHA